MPFFCVKSSSRVVVGVIAFAVQLSPFESRILTMIRIRLPPTGETGTNANEAVCVATATEKNPTSRLKPSRTLQLTSRHSPQVPRPPRHRVVL